MTIWGYSSCSLERVRRDHLQPPEGDRGHQVPADGVAQPAWILHPGHLQQDEGDGECSGGPAGITVWSYSSHPSDVIRINCTSWTSPGRTISSSTASTRWGTRRRDPIWLSLESGKFWGKLFEVIGVTATTILKTNCFLWLLKYLPKVNYIVCIRKRKHHISKTEHFYLIETLIIVFQDKPRSDAGNYDTESEEESDWE